MPITLEDQYQKKEKKECWEEDFFLVNGILTMLKLDDFRCVRPCFVGARQKSNAMLIF